VFPPRLLKARLDARFRVCAPEHHARQQANDASGKCEVDADTNPCLHRALAQRRLVLRVDGKSPVAVSEAEDARYDSSR
jgi:hypothetical protein